MRSTVRLTGILAAGLIAVFATTLSAPADAAKSKRPSRGCQEQTIHSEVRVGNKCCHADHFHYGSSGFSRTREQAMRGAARAWADFVAFEYGGAYANFNSAVAKKFTCSGQPGAWSCSVEARACH